MLAQLLVWLSIFISTVSLIFCIGYTFEFLILWSSQKHSQNTTKLLEESPEELHSALSHLHVIIPCLNEAVVISNTLNNLITELPEQATLWVVDDNSDDNTLQIISTFEDHPVRIITRSGDSSRQGKGQVLNYALHEYILPQVQEHHQDLSKVIIGVMDADSYVEETYFTRVMSVFQERSDIAALQSKVKIIPYSNGFTDITRMQDVEFSTILNAMQALRAKNANAALGGNGQFTRLSALKPLFSEGPWTSSLVEDFDLSVRMTTKGLKHIYHLDDVIVFQSGVSQVRPLLRQRARWAQGNMQSIKYLLRILKSPYIGFKGKVELMYYLAKPWLVLLMFLILIYVIIQLILFGWTTSIIPWQLSQFLGFILIFINYLWTLRYLKNNELQKVTSNTSFRKILAVLDGLYLSIFMIILSFAYVGAFINLIRRKKKWVKTERKVVDI